MQIHERYGNWGFSAFGPQKKILSYLNLPWFCLALFVSWVTTVFTHYSNLHLISKPSEPWFSKHLPTLSFLSFLISFVFLKPEPEKQNFGWNDIFLHWILSFLIINFSLKWQFIFRMLARGVNEEKIMNFLTLMNIDHKTGCQCCRATIIRPQWVEKKSEGAFLFLIICIFTKFKLQL